MKILLTGGTGYIASHTAVALIGHGHDVIALDNLSNSAVDTITSINKITGTSVSFVKGDIRDSAALNTLFRSNEINAVIHFAGHKSVNEAVNNPLAYYDNNVVGTLTLIEAMKRANVRNLVFSSSATVYGQPLYLPIDEGHPTSVTNPYGRSKLIVEEILSDLVVSDPNWRVAVLRYFNPVGAHSSGLIGESPNDIPNNLMPYLSRVAARRLQKLQVFGNDYDTPDGTGVRDFIHVEDLAQGHICALRALERTSAPLGTWNLGTGRGYSVLDMVRAFERVTGISVPFEIAPRRAGDVAVCYASPEKALRELGWKARLGLEEMCESAWRFERNFSA